MSASAGAPRLALRRGMRIAAGKIPWLVDAYRLARHPGWEMEVRRDLVGTRADAAFLRAFPPTPAGAPVALLALYRDDVYDAKVGLVLLSALRLAGHEPVVLVPSARATRARRYAAAFGIDRVVASESIALTEQERAEIAGAHVSLLERASSFDEVKSWTFRGRAVGTHVLSTLIRTTFDGSPDLALGTNRARLGAILHDVLRNVARAERLVAHLGPAVALVEEANYSTNGPLVDVLVGAGVDVIQTIPIWREDALMSKRLTPDTRRVDAKSVSPETLERLSDEPWTAVMDAELDTDFAARYGGRWRLGRQFQRDTEDLDADAVVRETGVDPNRPTAIVFAHVLWDASLFFGVDLFENYADWLVQTIGAAIETPDVNWVVKAHPSNVSRRAHGDVQGESSEVTLVRRHFPELPEHVHLLPPETRISTLSLYRFADYGVTVRGTPGLEIACFGKPAFTAGTGTYAGLGFTYDSASTGEYLDRLRSIATYGPLPADMRLRARRYAHTLFVRRPWPTRSFEMRFPPSAGPYRPLDRNIGLTAKSVDEMRARGDLDRWAGWVADSREVDLLA